MENVIIIKKSVLHILDINSQVPVLSQKELEVNDDLQLYLSKHISKVIEDPNTKSAKFIENGNNILFLSKMLQDNESDFLEVSSDISSDLFDLLKKHIDIPAADLVCCLFNFNSIKYLGLLKLNYKTGFTHWVDRQGDESVNTIIQYQTLLPLENQKIEECVLINLEDFSLKLLEKTFEINGEKDFYLSKLFLKCSSDLSDNSKLKIINKVAKDINKKYFDEDFEKAIKVKKAISESIESSDSIDIEKVAQNVFEKDITIQNEYIEEIAKAGIKEKTIVMPEKIVEKKFTTQKIKTDTGIEVNFPLEYADNQDKIEFINNPNGSISIIIKNIGKITNK